MKKFPIILLISYLLSIISINPVFAQAPAVKRGKAICQDPVTLQVIPCPGEGAPSGSSYQAPSIPDYGYQKASQYPGGVAGYLVSETLKALKEIIAGPFKIMKWMLDKIFQ